MLIPYRNGAVKIGNKTFSRSDINDGIIMRDSLIPDHNWFGGRVYGFGKVKEYAGLFLCIEGQINDKGDVYPGAEVIGAYIPDMSKLNEASIEILKMEGLYNSEPVESHVKLEKVEDEKEPEEIKFDPVKAAEMTSKVNEIVNKKLESRPRRVSNPV